MRVCRNRPMLFNKTPKLKSWLEFFENLAQSMALKRCALPTASIETLGIRERTLWSACCRPRMPTQRSSLQPKPLSAPTATSFLPGNSQLQLMPSVPWTSMSSFRPAPCGLIWAQLSLMPLLTKLPSGRLACWSWLILQLASWLREPFLMNQVTPSWKLLNVNGFATLALRSSWALMNGLDGAVTLWCNGLATTT